LLVLRVVVEGFSARNDSRSLSSSLFALVVSAIGLFVLFDKVFFFFLVFVVSVVERFSSLKKK
jgi:hypothetical protein